MKSSPLRVRSGNLTLAANVYGEASNPPVLLVHGYPDDSHTWHKIVPLLARDCYVITYDVRGCGRSDVPRDRAHYGMRYLMADIFAVAQAASPERPVHLVGHDWGSIQSWEAVTEPGAERYLASYTTISGPCLDHVGLGIRQSFKENPVASLNQLLHSWYIGFFHLPLLAPSLWKLGLDRKWPALVARMEGIKADPTPLQRKDGVNGINLYRANILKHLLKPRQRFAQVPVQAIIAKRDAYVTATLLRNLPLWAEDLRTHELDTSHWGALLEKHEATAGFIRDFVRDIDALNALDAGTPRAKALSSGA